MKEIHAHPETTLTFYLVCTYLSRILLNKTNRYIFMEALRAQHNEALPKNQTEGTN